MSKPIAFNEAMLQAIAFGHKTQTRRPLRVQPPEEFMVKEARPLYNGSLDYAIGVGPKVWPPIPQPGFRYPYGKKGVTLSVKGSNMRLLVTGVFLERLQDIQPNEIIAEGIEDSPGQLLGFTQLWDSIYKDKFLGWDTNPWVFTTHFERIETE